MLPLLVPSVQAAVSEPRDPSSGVAPSLPQETERASPADPAAAGAGL